MGKSREKYPTHRPPIKDSRDEADSRKNREKAKEREMRLKRSSSEDTSSKVVPPRSLTPPLNKILEKTKSASNSVSSSSEGRRSTTADDSESSSGNSDRRKYLFKSKTKEGSNRTVVKPSTTVARRSSSSSAKSRSPHRNNKMKVLESIQPEPKIRVDRSSTRSNSSTSINKSQRLMLQKAVSNRRIVIKPPTSSDEESDDKPSTSQSATKNRERIINSFYASWNKRHNKGSDASEKSRDNRSRSRLRDEHGYRSALRSTVIRVGSPWRRSRSKSMASNDSTSRSSSLDNKHRSNSKTEKSTSSNFTNPWKMEPKRRRLDTAEEANDQVETYRYKHEISVGSNDPRPIPKPVTTFRAAGFDEKLLKELERQDFEEPLPVQAQGWPVAQAGNNLAITGPSGSGKTLCYLLPAIDHILSRKSYGRRATGPIVVILVANREAAVQVQKEAETYTPPRTFQSLCLCGMGQRQKQLSSFGSSCEMVIATPGRLLDILTESDSDTGYGLDRCTFMVVDGSDRMLEMGLEGQLNRIFRQLSRRTQLIFASTLWSRGQERMAKRFLEEYTLVRVGYAGNASYKLKTRQRVEILKEEEKLDQLKKELTEIYDCGKKPGKVVVYAERKKCVDDLVAFIQDYVPCEGVHGGRTQVERDGIIQEFREGVYNIIVATDLTSRGMEIPGIRYVINYDFPSSIDGYVQRLARTGFSLSDTCEVITFFTNENEKNSQTLVKILEESNQFVDPRLKEWARFNPFNPLDPAGKRGSSGRKRGGRGSKARRNRVRQRPRRRR
ncbi:uncharacterized protein [Drosophila bipectinata]|uniref:uncharacterized protein n=1 Tax=Drosophila bipectinata TaxID=42026 RepID=UPI0038B3BCD7